MKPICIRRDRQNNLGTAIWVTIVIVVLLYYAPLAWQMFLLYWHAVTLGG
jgi:cell division protein FtsW (lipid II flippase)